MKVLMTVQPPSLADQLKGNPQKALKEKAEETVEKIKQELIEPEQEAQNKIDLLAQLLNFFVKKADNILNKTWGQ